MSDTLQAGQSLPPGGQLTSSDGSHRLVFQGDGNVVVYNIQNKPTFSTNSVNTATDTSTLFIMQGDGNLVLYGERIESAPPGKPPHPPTHQQIVRFNSGTGGQPGGYLVMQGDGNLVIYRPEIVAVWSSHTGGK